MIYLEIYLACIIFVQIFAVATYNAKSDQEDGFTEWDYFYLCFFSPMVVLIIICVILLTIKWLDKRTVINNQLEYSKINKKKWEKKDITL